MQINFSSQNFSVERNYLYDCKRIAGQKIKKYIGKKPREIK